MQEKDIGYLIKNINDRLKARADADLKDDNLTLSQSRVLHYLMSRGGSATQKEIELFLEVSHPTVVGIVSRMEQNGHVVRRVDETERRNRIVTLTPAAEALGEYMVQKVHANEARMLASLSEKETAELRRMLTLIYNNLE